MDRFISPSEVVDALEKRIEDSRKVLEGKGALDLGKFKLFCFLDKKWQRIKGRSVQANPWKCMKCLFVRGTREA